MDEQAVIARLKRGDIGGLEELVRTYQTQAVRTAYLITRDRALAEDIVQGAFLQVYRRIGQFDAARPFAPWFMRSVANAAIKAAARNQRQFSLNGESPNGGEFTTDLLVDPSPDPSNAVEARELRQMIWTALGSLSPEQRAVIVLRYYLDFSEKEMAEALNCPPGTVKWRLHAARERLRILLGEQYADREGAK